MKKRIFIVHAWGYSPKSNWYPWLRKGLENKGFIVKIPSMPDTECPKIEAWIPYLAKAVGEVDENTFFVGHSIGCQTILRYLETLQQHKKVGGVVFVAGFLRSKHAALMGLTSEEKQIIKPWLETPIDFRTIRQHCNKFTAIFSTNDPYVPLDDKDTFEEKFGAKIIIEENKGHFDDGSGITKLPIALTSLLEIVNS